MTSFAAAAAARSNSHSSKESWCSSSSENRPMPTQVSSLLAALVGEIVKVKLTDGRVIEGMVDPQTVNQSSDIIVSLCCLLEPDQRVLNEQCLKIPLRQIRWMKCEEMSVSDQQHQPKSSFQTDTAISGARGSMKERKLEKWVPDSPAPSTHEDLNKHNSTWDQFSANERLFGVKTEFDELAYTTPIDRQSLDFKVREHRAERLAREIQADASQNVHLSEERGGEVSADEEDLYGAVQRLSPPGFTESLFEKERLKISREMALVEAELKDEPAIEMPDSVKSKLNPSAAVFTPSQQSHVQAAAVQEYSFGFYDEYGNWYANEEHYQQQMYFYYYQYYSQQ